jgi:hypothetical protein
VQAGHAVAEFLLRGPFSRWNNGTLIYLGVKGLRQLERIKDRFEKEGIKHSTFVEPDLNNEITAIATDIQNKYVERLNLL